MRDRPVRPIILASASGILLPLCFPRFDLGLLAWISLIPLHLALDGSSRWTAFRLGWLTGTIGFTGIMSWVVTAMHTYGKVPLLVSYAIMLLLTVYLGLFVALYSAGLVWFRSLVPRYGLFAAPCLWVSLELVRTYLFSGLPWSLLGYSQYRQIDVIQIADHLGVYGVSFLIVLVNVAVAELIAWLMPLFRGFVPARLPWELVTTSAILVGLSWAYSTSLIVSEERRVPKSLLRVGVVQPNVDQAMKWDKAYRDETLKRYDRLTETLGAGTDLVVWPEAATPFLYEREPLYQLQLLAIAHRAGAPLLFGSPAVRFNADKKPFLLNSAYFLSPQGALLGRYDKQHLVPFGEYIPLKSSVLFFLDKLVEGIGDFEAGPGPTVFSFTPKTPVPGQTDAAVTRTVKFGVVICYEVIFPDLVRRFAANGAEFLVTITNDAWFGDSSAPMQHFSMVVFRSVENHLAFARSANTGISGFIDPFGRIIRASPIFTEEAFHAEIPALQSRTFYSRHGDVFAYGCVLISLILILFGLFRTEGPAHSTVAATPV
ncbi:Apolipoprotein N-acyltransferase [Nitrospira sp. KM1]|uniref:apolipoprotein N-acyltransferase n=1 Tax=Nitrospira sp. KM1 TaxID=1936990 RepID=UPI0013A710F0|nr:apolipoprotein N-acyltransferase [Nitrospira sp. KM1]BCA53428.1 Apolipoprotein N-acyltransferase [Nitrospira sp. KM1]